MAEILDGPVQTNHLSRLAQADILDVAEETYDVLFESYAKHQRTRAMIHRIGLCVPASEFMREKLELKGYRASKRHSPMWIEHHYLGLPSEKTGEEVLIDPTWQQFLDLGAETSGLPKVLIGTRPEVVVNARSYGVGSREISVYSA